jgi:hypothetical protein
MKQPTLTSFVMVNSNWIPMDEVEFVNIEEDIQGRDLVTFEFDGQVHQSYVFSRVQ